MNRDRKTVTDILEKHVPRASDEQVESAGDRVLYRLHHATPRAGAESPMKNLAAARPAGKRVWPIFALAGVAAALIVAFIGNSPKDRPAPTRAGGTLDTLSDGSVVEARANSEFEIDTAPDGLRIRLLRGSVVVTAAKQSPGRHLDVHTRDVVVSVVGTIFFVTAGEAGSQVGVIEGKVRIRHSAAEVSLQPGQQISSPDFAKEQIVPDAFAWSRSAAQYMASLARPATPASPRLQNASFEVASIRPNLSEGKGGGLGPSGDRLVATNVTLKSLLTYAYQQGEKQVFYEQIVGAPGWAETDRFNIDAKIGSDARSLPIAQIREMLQSLLEDRFQLKARREMRELPIYNLVLVKGGPKLSADQTPPDPNQGFINFATEDEARPPLPRGAMRVVDSPSHTSLRGTAVPMSMLVSLLQGPSDRIIVDKTNFDGLFDVDVQFAKDSGTVAPPETPAPSLFAAIQALGVKLESGKAMLPVIVVGSVQKPSEN